MLLKSNPFLKTISRFPLMKLRKRVSLFLVIIFLLLFPFLSFGQYNVSGYNHTELRFNQIKTDRFQIVFPTYYEHNAQELARILDTLLPHVSSSLKTQAPLVPILIHPSSSKSNGLSVWAPKRMEFWMTSSPETYAYPFLWQLAIHEYRHSSQMQAMNFGLTKTLSRVFGEHILGAVSGIWVPYWFFEGDAVVAETAFAPTGRGQTPDYNMYFKAMISEGKHFGTDKILLGSMRDFVPNDYNLGYYMVSFARMKYGKDIWGTCLNYLGSSWWKLQSWGTTGDKSTRLSFEKLYEETVSFLKDDWAEQEAEAKQYFKENTVLKHWIKESKEYCHYKNPVQIDDSTLLAVKTSFDETQQLVKVVNGEEQKLLSLPYLMDSYFDYKDSCILYSQYSPNIRWQQESNADIIEYDLSKNKYRRLTSNAIIFNPAYYPSDSVMAAVETDSLDRQNLSIVAPDADFFKNRRFGEKIRSVYLKNKYKEDSYSFSYPAWEEASGDIFVVSTTAKGKQILRYGRETEEFTEITSPSYDNISRLKVVGNRLYFIKDVDNKYQLLSLDVENTSDVRIHTQEKYGVDSYFIYDSTIVLSSYTSDGYRIVSVPYREEKFDINQSSPLMTFAKENQRQENFILTEDKINKDTIFEVSRYKRYSHMLNFHSWAPLFVNIQAQELGYGITFMSQNLLSTSVLTAGFNLHLHEKNELYIDYTFSGLYPITDFQFTYRPRDYRSDLDSNIVEFINFDEVSIRSNITLPFTWINRNFYNNISLSYHYVLTNIFNTSTYTSTTLFNTMGYSAQFSNYSAQADNDLYPRWGHITKIKYLRTLTSDNSYILAGSTQIFFPGAGTNHSLFVLPSFQFNTPETYYFSNEINFVRGVYDRYPKKYYGLLLCYSMPLIYPDGGIKGMLYIKRVIARPFYNIGSYDGVIFRSIGTDVMAKLHLLNITVPLDLGFRIGYQRESEKYFASFLFSLDV